MLCFAEDRLCAGVVLEDGRKEPGMKHRVFDWLVLVLVLIGGVLAWQSGRERSRLSIMYAGMVRKAGDLRIKDATKVHVQALETGSRLNLPGVCTFRPTTAAL